MAYRFILMLERKTQQIRRRIARHLPQWVKDALGLVTYVNFFKLEPTLSALFFAPQHFYEKLAMSVSGKTRFVTPVVCLTTSATMVGLLGSKVGLGKLWGLRVSYWFMLGLVGIALTAPIWTLMLAHIVRYIRQNVGILVLLVDNLWDDSEDLLLSKKSRQMINRSLYIQGMLYFTIYFVAAISMLFMVTVGLGAALTMGAVFLFGSPKGWAEFADPLNNIISIITVITAVLLLERLVVQPLAFLFRSCLRVPTVEAFAFDLRKLKKTIEKAFLSDPFERERIGLSVKHEWCRLAIRMRRTERLVREQSPECLDILLKDRASACVELKGVLLHLKDDVDNDLIRSLDRACAGLPLVEKESNTGVVAP